MEKIVFIVAHPDDVACGAGGTALLLKNHYEIHVLCASKGECGIPGKSLSESAAIRELEERAADAHIKAHIHFLGAIDGEIFADRPLVEQTTALLRDLNPKAVFTGWTIDTHNDHAAVSELTRMALRRWEGNPELYYFELGLGFQTSCFMPDIYVDISAVTEEKIAMLRCHASQNGDNDGLLDETLRTTDRFRGIEARVNFAEAFKLPLPITNRFRSILFEI